MHRFFAPFPLSIDLVVIHDELLHQLIRVLRSEKGDRIILFDGDGSETEYEIVSIEKKSIGLKGVARIFPKTEPRKHITLYQALPNKIEKIEYILQKWVEVSIERFLFFRSDFSQKMIISDSKIARFNAIAREAVEQCGGLKLPEIVFKENIDLSHKDTYQFERKPLNHKANNFSPLSYWELSKLTHVILDTVWSERRLGEFSHLSDIGIWVGPEGGWSESERIIMNNNGFISAHFSERVLRTETAWVVVGFAFLNQ